jgi:hypothetical protein
MATRKDTVLILLDVFVVLISIPLHSVHNQKILLQPGPYIPFNTHSDTYYEHCEVVENIIVNHSFDNILIIGDFNLPSFSLINNNLINNTSTNIIINSYINYLGLSQFNNIPNYRNDNILDLFFSETHLDTIFPGCSLIPLVDSYHPPLEFLYSLNLPNLLNDQSNSVVFNFNACNFNEITRFFANIDMIPNFINLHLDAAICTFYEILNHSFHLFLFLFQNYTSTIISHVIQFGLTQSSKN